jgi:hypothetical protein
VVIAAEQYASRLVVPSSQQHSPMRWSSHKDHAQKALTKLVGPHLPATLKQVERAVAKAHADHEKTTSRSAAASEIGEPETEPAGTPDEVNDDLDVDERRDDLEDEDFDDSVRESEDEIDDVGGGVGRVYSDADPGL